MLQTAAAAGAAAGAAVLAAPAIIAGADPLADPVRIGHIGIGTRGIDLIKYTGASENAKVVAVCDIYKPHLERGIAAGGNPEAVRYHDYRDLLADPKVEAVIIAVPDHWHEQMAIDASNAGKAIYCEKGLTTSVKSAKLMRKVIKKNKTVFQLGHQGRQFPSTAEAGRRINDGEIGPVTLIRVGRYFNGTLERAPWRWYGYYDQWERPDPAEVLKNLDWEAWLGPAPKIDFNEKHFWHWRCYWPYGAGQAGDLLSHELDHVQCVLRWGIPDTCACTGFNAFYKDGRETPDTWLASYTFEKHDCSLTFEGCMNSGREQYPEYVGKKGRIAFNGIGQDANRFALYNDEPAFSIDGKFPVPQFVYNATKEDRWPNHMDDFLGCVRTGAQPKCHIDEAFIEVVSYLMSVEAYKAGRQVRWDAEDEKIV
jgi:predicted dehydrogenase